MSDAEILQQARELITNRQYREARQLLLRIPDNPTAAKWLAKIDERLLAQAARPAAQNAPRNPQAVARPPMPMDTPLDNPVYIPYQHAPTQQQPMHGPAPIPPSAYALPKKSTEQQVRQILFTLIGGAALLVIVFVVSLAFNAQAITFQNQYLSFTHPRDWRHFDQPYGHNWCTDPGDPDLQCHYYMGRSRDYRVNMLFTYLPLTPTWTAMEFAEFNWGDDAEEFGMYERSLQELTIGGLPAVAQSYFISDDDDDTSDNELYIVDIYIVDGQDGYVIDIWSFDTCDLATFLPEVNTILSSVRFASKVAPLAEDGLTPPSEVALSVPEC